MKDLGRNLLQLLLALFLLLTMFTREESYARQPVRVIFDTDISSDVDDVGAVAVLHALANQGKVDILGMMVSSGDPWSAPCLNALNTWFGRPDIPVGKVHGESIRHTSKYTKEIASTYPYNIDSTDKEIDAVKLYRRLLSEQPDNSVTIITVGYLTNLANLLKSVPDSISSLNGMALVRKKVRQLICMGGKYPSGREWNFYQDAKATADVISRWPVPILFCGYESGLSVLTGSGLQKVSGPNPVSRSYDLYNGLTDRPSWDQLTILFGIFSPHPLAAVPGLFEVQRGRSTIAPDGSNRWIHQEDGPHAYSVNVQSNSQLKKVIEDMMVAVVEHALSSH